MASFKETFAKERKRLGKGKTFTWNGKSYSTNYAEEESTPLKSSPRPKAKPAAKPAAKSPADAKKLARLKGELAMQKDRSAVRSGMTLRERNQP